MLTEIDYNEQMPETGQRINFALVNSKLILLGNRTTQLSGVHNTILQRQERLAIVGAQIVQFQTALDQLSQQRVSNDHYVREHQAILSPILRLPFGLLGEIFTICANGEHRKGTPGYWTSQNMPSS